MLITHKSAQYCVLKYIEACHSCRESVSSKSLTGRDHAASLQRWLSPISKISRDPGKRMFPSCSFSLATVERSLCDSQCKSQIICITEKPEHWRGQGRTCMLVLFPWKAQPGKNILTSQSTLPYIHIYVQNHYHIDVVSVPPTDFTQYKSTEYEILFRSTCLLWRLCTPQKLKCCLSGTMLACDTENEM